MIRPALFSSLSVVFATAAIAGCASSNAGGGTGGHPGGSGGIADAAQPGGDGGSGGSGGANASGGAPGTGGGGNAMTDAADAPSTGESGPAPADGGPWDPASLGGASKCAQSGFQLCDDFESGAVDKATWTVDGTAPVIDDMHVARGSKALHITVPNGASTRLHETKTFRETDDTYFGRIFVYFKTLPTPTGGLGYSHWTLLAASGDGPGAGGEIRFGAQMMGGVNRFGTGTDNQSAGGTGDWTNIDQDPAPDGKPAYVPTGVWLCLEWMHAGPPANETKIWIDGVEHTSMATTETMHGTKLSRAVPTAGMGNFILPNFTALWVGWQAYSGKQDYELWMDEIAVNHTRIGCEN
ncbi:MAG TPA: hypothetical protein VMU50_19430 [Polyangia bacterium]|nr:hypothetical protein [Polyangia bacterium]